MIHPATEVRFCDEAKGYGLFATSHIPRGTITWVRDALDREISPGELELYLPPVQEVIFQYSYRNKSGNYIFCWDNTRYINHDNQPNTCLTPYQLEIAVRDIFPDEEITNHYGTLNIIEPFTLPGDKNITIYPDDLLRHSKDWDQSLSASFAFLVKVDQPLKHLISQDRWCMVKEVSLGRRQMLSIAQCLFQDTYENLIGQ